MAPPKSWIPKALAAAVVVVLIIGFLAYVAFTRWRRGSGGSVQSSGEEASTQFVPDAAKAPALIRQGDATPAVTADLPAYPGSTPTQLGGQDAQGNSFQEFESSDSVDAIVTFYRGKLAQEPGASPVNVWASGEGADFILKKGAATTHVEITRSFDERGMLIDMTRQAK